MSTRGHTILKTTVGIIIVTVLVGYGLFQARLLIQGPTLSIESPQNGTMLRSALVDIEGHATNITSIRLNDRVIYVNEDGEFDESVVLSRGYNVVTVEAEDRFGRQTSDVLQLVHEPITDDESPLSQQPTQASGPNESS